LLMHRKKEIYAHYSRCSGEETEEVPHVDWACSRCCLPSAYSQQHSYDHMFIPCWLLSWCAFLLLLSLLLCCCILQASIISPHVYPPTITGATFLGADLWRQCDTAFGYLQSKGTLTADVLDLLARVGWSVHAIDIKTERHATFSNKSLDSLVASGAVCAWSLVTPDLWHTASPLPRPAWLLSLLWQL
jgi:hypothetical protein